MTKRSSGTTTKGQEFISRIFNIRTGRDRAYCPDLSTPSTPGGKYALTVDFGRLQYFRPGYGYPSKKSLTVDVKGAHR